MANGPINPAAISIEQLAQTLRAAGSTAASAESIQRHIDDGAPTNNDGTVNLLNYAAWLVKEMGHGKG